MFFGIEDGTANPGPVVGDQPQFKDRHELKKVRRP